MCASVISPPLHLTPTAPFHLVTSPSYLTVSTRHTQPSLPVTTPSRLRRTSWPTTQSQRVWGHQRLAHRWLTYLSGSRSTSCVGRIVSVCSSMTHAYIYTHAHAHTQAYTQWNLHRRHSEMRHLCNKCHWGHITLSQQWLEYTEAPLFTGTYSYSTLPPLTLCHTSTSLIPLHSLPSPPPLPPQEELHSVLSRLDWTSNCKAKNSLPASMMSQRDRCVCRVTSNKQYHSQQWDRKR